MTTEQKIFNAACKVVRQEFPDVIVDQVVFDYARRAFFDACEKASKHPQYSDLIHKEGPGEAKLQILLSVVLSDKAKRGNRS
jgi:hypothetical protein